MNDVVIRPATPDDIPELLAIIDDAVRGLSTSDYSRLQIESALQYIFGVDSQLIADGTYYVAQVDDVIAGCGGWSQRKTLFGGDQMKTNAGTLLDPAYDPAKIRAFFVRSAYARQGIGRRILLYCEEQAYLAGFKHMELMATLTGVPLYATSNFVATEQSVVSMPDGVTFPVVHMVKNRT